MDNLLQIWFALLLAMSVLACGEESQQPQANICGGCSICIVMHMIRQSLIVPGTLK